MDLFKDILPAIQKTKKDLTNDQDFKKSYNAFVVNRALSYHVDSILHANEMNLRHGLDENLQFQYYLSVIRSMKRPFIKWVKPPSDDDLIAVKQYFKISTSKAREALKLLDVEKIKQIKEKISIGGVKNTK